MNGRNQQLATENDDVYLEFKVGPLHFCAPALDVIAIISPPKMTSVPLSADIIASCFEYHNETVTVLSMHNKFGLPFTRETNKTHIILARVDDGLKGFWVDQAINIMPLDNFGTSDDYYTCEGKAYSNFLTREEDIILQTSYQRLYFCNGSNLNWIAKMGANKADENTSIDETDTAGIDQTATAGDMSAAEIAESPASDKNTLAETEKAETEKIAKQSKPIDVPQNVIEESHEVKVPPTHNDENAGSQMRPTMTASMDSAFSNNRNLSRDASYEQNPSVPLQSHHHARTVVRENELENSGEKGSSRSDYMIIVMVALTLLMVALGSVYLLTSETDSAIKTPSKVTSKRETSIAKELIKYAEEEKDVAEKIELAPPVMELSINETLNEVVQEDESMPDRSENARVFELHVNEKSDSNLYTITKFEPMVNQQEQFSKEKQKSASTTQIFTHVVIKGDTLWHITRRYLDNPYRYPELAAASHINNPHRIYPGDIVRIIVNKTKTE